MVQYQRVNSQLNLMNDLDESGYTIFGHLEIQMVSSNAQSDD